MSENSDLNKSKVADVYFAESNREQFTTAIQVAEGMSDKKEIKREYRTLLQEIRSGNQPLMLNKHQCQLLRDAFETAANETNDLDAEISYLKHSDVILSEMRASGMCNSGDIPYSEYQKVDQVTDTTHRFEYTGEMIEFRHERSGKGGKFACAPFTGKFTDNDFVKEEGIKVFREINPPIPGSRKFWVSANAEKQVYQMEVGKRADIGPIP